MKAKSKTLQRGAKTQEQRKEPIFYDGSKLRGKIFLAFLALTFITFGYIQWKVYQIIFTDKTQSILQINHTNDPSVSSNPGFTETVSQLNQKFTSKLVNPKRVAFYVTWNPSSFESLKKNINNIDILIPEFLSVSNSGFTSIDPEEEKDVLAFVKKANSNTKITPLITNYNEEKGSFDSGLLNPILQDKNIRAEFIGDLYDYVVNNKYDGINIDFEDIPDAQQYQFVTFMKELNTKFKESNLLITQDVSMSNTYYNYAQYAKYSDYLIFMAYDYNWSTGKPGPIAPDSWTDSSFARIKSAVPNDKVIIALGNYGYAWGKDKQAVNKTYSEVLQLAKDNNAKIQLDKVSKNPYFTYKDSDQFENKVWFLDATSFYNEVLEINKYPFAGIALWSLGSEDQSIWDIMKNPSKPLDGLNNFSTVQADLSQKIIGSGGITRVQALAQNGIRTIALDTKTGKITTQDVTTYPIPYTIQKWGGNDNKKIAFTFDDGPDPIYTEQILEILKENNIKATFFVVGRSANIYPNIVKEIYASGNEIGNHTYLHPNIESMSFNKIYPELNATGLLLQDITGRKSAIFRAPFSVPYGQAEDNQLDNDISGLGFYNVGIDIDPKDWLVMDSDKIINETIDQIQTLTPNNLILMHDGGGDRSQTVKALPIIISKLKEKGYSFVTVSELMGVEKDTVMPPIITAPKFHFSFDKAEFSIINFFAQFFGTVFVTGILIGIIKSLITIILALINKYKESKIVFDNKYLPKVAVVVPAWNEAKVITKTVNILLKNKYPKLEIIIIDDGSTDDTYKIASEAYKDAVNVKVLTTVVNCGKSAAINFALKNSRAPIFIVQDADTVLAPDAVFKLIRHMKDKNVAAVAGNVKVGNRDNLLTKFQGLEYVISQNLDRRAFALLNAISVVPGAIGAWRRDVVIKSGGFHSDTLAEDAELTLRILRLGYKIKNEGDAIGYTEAPDNFNIFVKQRFRWMFGTLQAIWKVRYATLNVKNWALGFIVIPNVLVFQIIFSVLAPFVDLYVLLSLVFMLWQKSINPEMTFQPIHTVLIYYALFTVIDVLVGVVGFFMESRESKKLIFLIPLQRLFHKYVMYLVSMKALYTAINGPHVKWEIKQRKATVNELIALSEVPAN